MSSDHEARIRHVTAVLGPTNTGKTHLAIERMLGHESGMIGLPLRLLAREVYDKIASRVGKDAVALVTGEEKIKPDRARYWVATVEAMPRDVDVDFLAIDEVQLAGDPERGHVFTDRMLHSRGRSETLLLGAQTMRDAISDLIPGANFISRPRLSKLSYAGEKKITRIPARSAVVAFSANEVYAIAELIRRQRGGTAVVLGALSPRTRNAQVALYQSGDVDFLVATDAIGMGLNLDVDHVAFAATRKFDGVSHRNLTPAELGQIAGRAGRHMNDGTFGVTGAVEPFDADTVERLETHNFEPVRVLQWRNRHLEFSSLSALRESLREMPREQRLTRARTADDVEALETVCADREVVDMARSPAAVAQLWDVCQIPDYRKISGASHAELVATVYKFLLGPDERIPEDWFAKQVDFSDRTDGDIDTLANRIAHIRTWTFVSNREAWLADPAHWQGRTREIEDSLSDALHERLTQRFVDRRTSALMKGMRDKEELTAEIGDDGSIKVENHYVGRLKGFRFSPDAEAEGIHGKAARHAAAQVLSRELAMRARRVASAKVDAFKIDRQGQVMWRDEAIAKLEPADDPLKPGIVLLADDYLSASDREKIEARLQAWIVELVGEKLKPLIETQKAEDIAGLARGIGFRLVENFGVLKRDAVADEIKSLDQTSRAQLRKYGVRFGAFNIYYPPLLKPAAADLLLALWALKHAQAHGLDPRALPEPPRAGLTSALADPAIPEAFYRAAGYHLCGPRVIRLDILERLADIIRPLLAWRPSAEMPSIPPKGATGEGGFTVTPDMMSILGCSPDELSNVLKALGFWVERRPAKKTLPDPAPAPATGELAPTANADVGAPAGEPAPAAAETASVGEDAKGFAGVPVGQEGARADGDLASLAGVDPPEAVAPTGEAARSDTAVKEAKEPAYEEIWRPRRHRANDGREEHGRRRGRGPRRGARQTEGAIAAASQPPGPGAPTRAADVGAAAPAEGQGHAGGYRPGEGKQRGDRWRGNRRDHREHDRRHDGKPGRRGDEGRPREERRPEMMSARPRKKGGIDPDSPFAALGALKESLERRDKEKNSP